MLNALVTFPTHNKNHILELVITSSDSSLTPSLSSTHCSPSDHFPVFTKLSINPTPLPPPTIHSFRRLHSIDTHSFLTDLTSSRLITHPPKSLGSLLISYTLLSLLCLISMLPSSPNSPGVRLNPTPGSPLHYEPSGPLFATLRTSGNAPTLLSTGPPSSLCATSTTTSFSQPRNTSTLTSSPHPLTTPSASGKL